MAARSAPRARGELEDEVLACLATADGPLTPAEVQAGVGRALAYTTVMTTLSRLYAKGAVQREPDGRAYRYWLPDGIAGARSSMTAHRMLQLLPEGADRKAVLAHFVGELSPGDERTLTALLARAERAAARRPRER